MLNYIIKRLFLIIPTLFGILAVNFIIIQAAPGGPVEKAIAQIKGTEVSVTERFTSSGGEQLSSSQTRNNFRETNSEFAKRFLNSSWEQSFPRKFTSKSVYKGPQTPGELGELEDCFEQALRQMEIPDGLLSKALILFREEALRTH